MKYYTDELWTKVNSESAEERLKAEEQWDKNDEEYTTKIFQNIKKRLTKNFMNIYLKEHGFHDYHLKDFKIKHGERGFKDPVEVRLTVTNEENTWTIIYKKIKKIVVNYEQEPDLFPGMGRRFYEGFDDYGYDELLNAE